MLHKLVQIQTQANLVSHATEFCLGHPTNSMGEGFTAGTTVVGSYKGRYEKASIMLLKA